jgi:hypothetical protein
MAQPELSRKAESRKAITHEIPNRRYRRIHPLHYWSSMPDVTITLDDETATRIQDYSVEYPHADQFIHDLATLVRLARLAPPGPHYCTTCGHRLPGHYESCPHYDDSGPEAARLHPADVGAGRVNDATLAHDNDATPGFDIPVV